MKVLLIISTMLMFVTLWIACGSKSVDITPVPTKRVIKGVPKWFDNPSEYIPNGNKGAVAVETSRDMMIAREKAQNAARGELRLQIEDIGETGNDRFVRETGLGRESEIVKRFEGGNRSASSAVLKNSSVHLSETNEEGDIYRVYVLMILPDPELELLRQIEKDKELMEKFEATDYFNELSERLEKYRKRQSKR